MRAAEVNVNPKEPEEYEQKMYNFEYLNIDIESSELIFHRELFRIGILPFSPLQSPPGLRKGKCHKWRDHLLLRVIVRL